MTKTDSFIDFWNRLAAGDVSAEGELFLRFSAQMHAVATFKLDPRVPPLVSPSDILQSAFNTFFQSHKGGRVSAESWESLSGFLAVITLRKCIKHNRRLLAMTRGVAKTTSLQESDEEFFEFTELISREPTPEEVTVYNELLSRLLALTDERQRPVIQLKMEGYTLEEISRRVELSERTCRRIVANAKQQLARLLEENS